jgi:hypothetical protein
MLKSVYHSKIAISIHALLSRTVGDKCATEIMSPSSGLYHHGSQPIGILICAGSFIGVLPPAMRLSFVFAVLIDESGQMDASSCHRAPKLTNLPIFSVPYIQHSHRKVLLYCFPHRIHTHAPSWWNTRHHGGWRRPTAAMVPHPRLQGVQIVANMQWTHHFLFSGTAAKVSA